VQFPNPLVRGTLIRRYKRFLSDITLEDGTEITAHVANPGSMIGLTEPGSEVWLSPNTNPKAKLAWRWELIRVGGFLVGVNTAHPNRLVEEALARDGVSELTGYASCRREVKYGQNSRIDLLLEDDTRPPCYVEIKNVNLKRGLPDRETAAEFPDAVTKRGAKHLVELGNMVAEGNRAVMLYLVQRGDCDHFRIADDIDPAYAAALTEARTRGVETLCYACDMRLDGIDVAAPLPLVPDSP
jgi:sugar fermentation stimulation protein A